jgi:preprotein translocase subunit SecF
MLDLVSKRYVWFAISLLLIIPGFIFLLMPGGGLRPSIDFAGGTLWEFAIPNRTEPVGTSEIGTIFAQNGVENAIAQVSTPNDRQQVVVTVRSPEVKAEDPRKQTVTDAVAAAFPETELTRFETVGATVSRESTQQAVLAVLAASLAIMAYLTFAFREAPNPLRYGVCAIIAMLHDVLLVLGIAAILGYFIGLEVDALFLMALLLFGGQTIQHFVLILLIGLLSGTYSSIFNAAQLLVVWENGWGEDWKRVSRRDHGAQVAA